MTNSQSPNAGRRHWQLSAFRQYDTGDVPGICPEPHREQGQRDPGISAKSVALGSPGYSQVQHAPIPQPLPTSDNRSTAWNRLVRIVEGSNTVPNTATTERSAAHQEELFYRTS